MLEKDFQPKLIRAIKDRFPGCTVMKTDPRQIQGIPDLLVLHKDKWALLETKAWCSSKKRPNQDFRVNHYNQLSFSAFVNPTNMEDVLNDMERSFY